MIPTQALGTLEDTGALLATVLDQTHDCIKLLDRDGAIQYVNERGAIAMELRTPSELVGLKWIERWPEEARSMVEQALNKAQAGEVARFIASRIIGSKPSWWDVTVTPVQSAQAVEHLLVIAREMTAEVRERERVDAVSAEMRHRLRNAMSIASALVQMGARGRPELQTFAADIAFRLAQLARVQELVLDPSSKKSFGQLITLLGDAYENLEIGPLPEVELEDRLMQAIALTFGELVTNSLKYGGLKHHARVRVDGRIVGDGLELTWREETVFAQARAGGQGLSLIDRIVRASGGRVERRIEDRQLLVRTMFPLQNQETTSEHSDQLIS